MNDRFKFRVYNVYNDGGIFRIDTEENCYIHQDGLLFIGDEKVSCFDAAELETEDCKIVVQQCTGIKDKNGVLIYEGDIVLFDEEYGTIEFDEACFLVTVDNVTRQLSEIYEYELEIVGNIYENPELLGDNGKLNDEKQPKADCVHYSVCGKADKCEVLNRVYCKVEECKFYKEKGNG